MSAIPGIATGLDALLIGKTVKVKALQTKKFTAQHTKLPEGIEATDTATCYDCRDGIAYPGADGWTCHDCGGIRGYGDETTTEPMRPIP